MNITLKHFKELENGGAELILEADEKGKQYLLNYAIIEILKKSLTDVEELHK